MSKQKKTFKVATKVATHSKKLPLPVFW